MDTTIDTADTTTPRDEQRTILQDLIRLASECVKLDAAIERDFAERIKTADNTLKAATAQVMSKSVEAIGLVQEVRATAYDAAKKQLDEGIATADKNLAWRREKINDEFTSQSNQIKRKARDDQWLADSVMESAIIAADGDHRESLEKVVTDRAQLDQLRDRGLLLLNRYGHQQLAVDYQPPARPDTPSSAYADAQRRLEQCIDRLDRLPLARLFVGAWPFVAAVALVGLAVVATQPWNRELATEWQPPVIVSVVASVVAVIGYVLLSRLGDRQVNASWTQALDALGEGYAALDRRMTEADQLRDQTITDAKQTRERETSRIHHLYTPLSDAARRKRDEQLTAAIDDHDRQQAQLNEAAHGEMARIVQHHADELHRVEHDRDTELGRLATEHQAELGLSKQDYEYRRSELQRRWREGLERSRKYDGVDRLPGCVRFGSLTIDLERIAEESGAKGMRLEPPPPYRVPAWLAMPRQASLLVEHDRAGRDDAISLVRATVHSLLSTLPAGRARFVFIDPVGLGQSFAAFMHLADFDDALVGGRIWAEQQQIEQRLVDLTEHMETVIQKYLRNEFTTIDQYNAQAGQLAEPYRFLVIADAPTNFSDEALRRLATIATTGARCGVYVIATRDARQPFAAADVLEDLRASCTVLEQKVDRFHWRDGVFGRFAFTPSVPPDDDTLTRSLHAIGAAAKQNKRVEVPFDAIAPNDRELWTRDAATEVSVSVGRTGATRLQAFRLGRGVAQHALIAGKTGSGKSTLLNVLITNVALWYSPDEVEMYLIDFKRGVEFKAYATHHLPHARAVAVESDREFGLSVLQRLDAELNRRGELFRRAGVQDLAAYRRESPGKTLPRQLLIVDEFQELFTEDDKLSQESALLIDRLVRQGRAFGIHVVLGSQTIGGTTALPRTTYGQMAVRVALQCTEADSQLILGDNNSAARLLSRPGEAIYNDAGGLIENNSPFQVSWLDDDHREQLLRHVARVADERGYANPGTAIFEGNAPAHIESNIPLRNLVRSPVPTTRPDSLAAYLGEAVAIKPPTSITLRRRAGANVLVLGQADEQATAVLAVMGASMALQSPSGTLRLVVLDGTPADSALSGKLASALSESPAQVQSIGYRDAGQTLSDLASELARRREADSPDDPTVIVMIHGLQRYRDLRKREEAYSFSLDEPTSDGPKPLAPDKALAELLREGPAHGIHVIASVDTAAALDRTIERGMMREFDHRILFQMSAADSATLIDSAAANKLGSYRAIYFSEEQGVIEKFRPYALPATGLTERLR
jgi:ABC-type multidrug transport system fused ATPase/permease subunit